MREVIRLRGVRDLGLRAVDDATSGPQIERYSTIGFGWPLMLQAYVAALAVGVSFAVTQPPLKLAFHDYGNRPISAGLLCIPFVGPFLSAATYREPIWALPLALVDGGMQVSGLVMLIVGAVGWRGERRLRQHFSLLPVGGAGALGLAAAGHF